MLDYKKTMLLILDGWGLGAIPEADAIRAANTPFMDSLYQKYPHTTLTTFGYEVGLPEGQMGNSEVGHTNIGAGRVVYQDLARINKAIDDNTLIDNETLQNLIAYAKNNAQPIHLLGLVSDGGVHSHINHLKALVEIIENAGAQRWGISHSLLGPARRAGSAAARPTACASTWATRAPVRTTATSSG